MNNLRRLSTFLAVWFGAWLSRDQWVAGNHGYASLLFIAADLGLDRTDRMRIRLQRGEEIP
jgi:hypothetical protein